MSPRHAATAAVLLASWVLPTRTACAQTTPHAEVAVITAARSFENDEVDVRRALGIGGQFDINLNPLLALEARGMWFPREESSRFRSQGGRTTEISGGARATFVRRPRWSFYAVTLGGLTRASNTYNDLVLETEQFPEGPELVVTNTTGSTTRFMLTMGGGLEFRPSLRWTARVDWTSNWTPFSGAEVSLPPGPNGAFLSISEEGNIGNHDQFNVSIPIGWARYRRCANRRCARAGSRSPPSQLR